MADLDRRKLLHAGIALAVPFGCPSLLMAGQQSTQNGGSADQQDGDHTMQLRYLEIVTPDVDAVCKQYSAVHGITFGEPEPNLGNARTADIGGGTTIAVRGPLRDTETPVIRPYALVKDLDAAVAAAKKAGAEIAIPRMEIPGHGTIAIFIQGGIESGLWQD